LTSVILLLSMAAPNFSFPTNSLAKQLTLEEARAAIKEVVAAFNTPENLAKMMNAKQEAGADIMKMMTIVLPVAMSIQQTVITKFGYAADQQGVMQFTQAIRVHEADPEISVLAQQLKSQFLPKM